ncbi:MAG: hypothetical protein OXC95_03970 [Dehalococcoidia bacterium]|nr:hypothetical protein [Dehalococcoidia bacterium]
MHDTRVETSPPSHVGSEEAIARSIFSRNHVRRQTKVTFKAFDPPRNSDRPGTRLRDISVDRFDFLTETRAVQLGEERAVRRGTNVNFYGWAMHGVGEIRGDGRDVISTPSEVEDNPAHADIRLPQSTTTNDEERKDHLMILAECSQWVGRPDANST